MLCDLITSTLKSRDRLVINGFNCSLLNQFDIIALMDNCAIARFGIALFVQSRANHLYICGTKDKN